MLQTDFRSVEVRHARSGDADAIAQVHVASWQSAYAGLVPAAYLEGLDWRTAAEWWRRRPGRPQAGEVVLTARSAAGTVGFASVGPARDGAEPGDFELYALYVLPEAWRSGVGRALLAASLSEVPSQTERVTLWVLRDNHRARSFYVNQGFIADGATKTISVGGAELVEVRYFTAQ